MTQSIGAATKKENFKYKLEPKTNFTTEIHMEQLEDGSVIVPMDSSPPTPPSLHYKQGDLIRQGIFGGSTDEVDTLYTPIEKSPGGIRLFLLENRLYLIFCFLFLLLVAILLFTAWSVFDWKGNVVVFTVSSLILLLLKDFAHPSLILMIGVSVFLLTSIVSPQEAFDGFSNSSVISIALLLIVAEGVRKVKIMNYVVRLLLDKGVPKHVTFSLFRLLIVVGFFSAFLSNTPIVAMLIPVMETWSKTSGTPISKVLMPISFSAILGGTCSLLGTSTNLIIFGLSQEQYPDLRLNIFEISKVGIIQFIFGIIYILITYKYFLPTYVASIETQMKRNPREYTVAVRVSPGSDLAGFSINEAGLRNLPGLFLFAIERQDQSIPAVGGDTVIKADDTLIFAGQVDYVKNLWGLHGIVPATDQVKKIVEPSVNRLLVEVVLASHSPLINKTVKESKFRTRYNAAIIAVHRHGERLHEKIGDVRLKPGDVLLLESSRAFIKYHKHNNHFSLVSEIRDSSATTPAPHFLHISIVVILLSLMLITCSLGIIPIVSASLIIVIIMLFFRILTFEDAFHSVQGPLLVTIAGAFGIANGIHNTGVGDKVAEFIISFFGLVGPIGILFGIYISTSLMSNVVNNGATAAIMFPILSVIVSQHSTLNFKTLMYVLMLASSSSFSTPIGFQTNMMVMGPGGYKFSDFLKFGGGLQIISMFTSVFFSYFFWK